jgi:hypothetical protein
MTNTDEYYNLEDKTDYTFYSYVIVVETEHRRMYKLIENIDEATLYRSNNAEKFNWISPIWKTNKETYKLLDDPHLQVTEHY